MATDRDTGNSAWVAFKLLGKPFGALFMNPLGWVLVGVAWVLSPPSEGALTPVLGSFSLLIYGAWFSRSAFFCDPPPPVDQHPKPLGILSSNMLGVLTLGLLVSPFSASVWTAVVVSIVSVFTLFQIGRLEHFGELESVAQTWTEGTRWTIKKLWR